MITVVDYKLGNIKSVFRAFERIKVPAVISSRPEDIEKAEAVVVPGVGAFKKAMQNLKSLGLINPLKKHMFGGKPYLGICLGLQILFSRSFEHGTNSGLGIIRGEVIKLKKVVKIPHMGWNEVECTAPMHIFNGIEKGSYFYFDHSYHVLPQGKFKSAKCSYGICFVCAVGVGNIYGVQFHPEKSGEKGLKMLRNFSELCLPKE